MKKLGSYCKKTIKLITMKIISKYKDYYDYLQGIYGVDEKLVLDRRAKFYPSVSDFPNGKIDFVIGDLYISVLKIDDKIYSGRNELLSIGEAYEYETPSGRLDEGVRVTYKESSYPYRESKANMSFNIIKGKGRLQNTEYEKIPIIVFTRHNVDKFMEFPRLEEFGIQKILKPHDIWIELSSFLGKLNSQKEPPQPIGDDKVRILSAGFDLKTSFRNVK